jgi:hypothetical protein
MRENRLYGSEGGVAKAIPTPIRPCARRRVKCAGRDGRMGAAGAEQKDGAKQKKEHEKEDAMTSDAVA